MHWESGRAVALFYRFGRSGCGSLPPPTGKVFKIPSSRKRFLLLTTYLLTLIGIFWEKAISASHSPYITEDDILVTCNSSSYLNDPAIRESRDKLNSAVSRRLCVDRRGERERLTHFRPSCRGRAEWSRSPRSVGGVNRANIQMLTTPNCTFWE